MKKLMLAILCVGFIVSSGCTVDEEARVYELVRLIVSPQPDEPLCGPHSDGGCSFYDFEVSSEPFIQIPCKLTQYDEGCEIPSDEALNVRRLKGELLSIGCSLDSQGFVSCVPCKTACEVFQKYQVYEETKDGEPPARRLKGEASTKPSGNLRLGPVEPEYFIYCAPFHVACESIKKAAEKQQNKPK